MNRHDFEEQDRRNDRDELEGEILEDREAEAEWRLARVATINWRNQK